MPKLYLIAISGLILSGCTLIGSSKPAALQISSIPEASVFLDGAHLGKTPFYSDQLKKGEHTVKITASEASFTQRVNLTAETLTVINRELNDNFFAQSGEVLWLESGKNEAFISSNPTGASIEVDAKQVGNTPLLIKELSADEHKVTIKHQGYVLREFTIKTSPKYRLVADVTLASEIAKETRKLDTTKPDVEKLQVLRTPQGFLRVRREPTLSSEEVGQVSTGDQLEIIQEADDWVKISFEGKLGWISAAYTKKL